MGLALIVGFLLLYRAYRLTLAHSERLRQLEAENHRLRQELEALEEKYAEALKGSQSSREGSSPAQYLEQIARRIEGQTLS